jgi:hypothetical protein
MKVFTDQPAVAVPGGLRRWLRSDMRILRWVFLALYVLLVGSLLVGFTITVAEPMVLIPLAVWVVAQALFILGSGTIQLCRPIRRRRLLVPVIVAAAMMTVLIGAFAMAMFELFNWKRAPDWVGILFLVALGASWIIWGVLLFVHVRDMPRFAAVSRLAHTLFAGSLLELIATVPSHVIVSRRPGCLVGLLTMMGIVAGLGVMVFSFGPMIVLLFLRPRLRAEQRESAGVFCAACGYDLRASVDRCPECGLRFAAPATPAAAAPRA